jgi:hypothetical protein
MSKKAQETKAQRQLREARADLEGKEQALARAQAFLQECESAVPRNKATLATMWERYEQTLSDEAYDAIAKFQAGPLAKSEADLPLARKRVEVVGAAIEPARARVVDAELAVIREGADKDAALALCEAQGANLAVLMPQLTSIFDAIVDALKPLRDARAAERDLLHASGRTSETEYNDRDGGLISRVVAYDCATPEVSLADALRALRAGAGDGRWDDVARLFAVPETQTDAYATLPSVDGTDVIGGEEPERNVVVVRAPMSVVDTAPKIPKTPREPMTFSYGGKE